LIGLLFLIYQDLSNLFSRLEMQLVVLYEEIDKLTGFICSIFCINLTALETGFKIS